MTLDKVGKRVEVKDDNGDIHFGTIDSISIEDGVFLVVMDDGSKITFRLSENN